MALKLAHMLSTSGLRPAALAAKLERQQYQLHEGFAARDRTIRRLEDMLARRAVEFTQERIDESDPDQPATFERLVRDLDRRLARETARRERGDLRTRELAATLAATEQALAASARVTRRPCRSSTRPSPISRRSRGARRRMTRSISPD